MMATLLRRSGVSVRIVDQAATQAHESRALGIQARSLELFRNLGIVDEFLRQGQRAAGAAIFVHGRKRAGFDFSDMARKDTPYPYLFILSQEVTERILNED